jgi:hypothetical protein
MYSVAPDIQFKEARIFQREDMITAEYVVVGSHAASGKRVGVRGIALEWFDDEGKIKKEHIYIDQMTMLVQTGRAPGKAPDPVSLPSAEAPWIVAKNDATEEANVATFKTTWPEKALLARDFEHEEVASGALYKSVPPAEFATEGAWAFGNFVIAEMQTKPADGVARHVVVVAEHDKGTLVRSSLYANRLEGRGLPTSK